MNKPTGNRNPYNILHVVFTSFYPTILFLKEPQWKYNCTAVLCYPCYRTLNQVYRQSGSRLEEVDQQLSINISFCQFLGWSKWAAFLVSTSKVTVLKNLSSLYIHVIRVRSIVGSIEKWSEETRFYLWRYSVVTCHKLSHFLVGYRKLRSFQGTQDTSCVLLEKPDITYGYAEILIRSLYSQVADLVRRFRAMLKILYFSGSKKILQILPGKKSLYYWGRKIIHLLTGEA